MQPLVLGHVDHRNGGISKSLCSELGDIKIYFQHTMALVEIWITLCYVVKTSCFLKLWHCFYGALLGTFKYDAAYDPS